MRIGGILAVTWLFVIWGILMFADSLSLIGAGLVVLSCLVYPRQLWRARLLWLSTGLLLILAWALAWVAGVEDIHWKPYLTTFAVVLAPVAVSSHVDGFWICGWLTKARVPGNLILAIAAALGAIDLILDDVRALVYQRRRMPGRGLAAVTGTLAASFSILLDHAVSIEIAYEMVDIAAVFRRWRGRTFRPSEWLFGVQLLLLLVFGLFPSLRPGAL
jgi:hypothetical protein